ncbi:hypothetical protein STTU_6176 [Streptomyces sp. Tu6071]|nr:hypothetical protein STTU_6176 [Streptomyces sp. Tu6071]
MTGMSGTATTAVRGRGSGEAAAGRGTTDEPVMLGDVLPEVLRALAVGGNIPRPGAGRAAYSGPPGG